MRILDTIRLYIPVHDGIDSQSRYRLDAQFLGYVLPMADDRSEADVQFLGNFLVDKSFGDEYKYLNFAG